MVEKTAQNSRRLILLELNEINFEIARNYAAGDSLRSFQSLLSGPSIHTTSEQKYECLEPWIQWPSAHSGLSAEEHQVFRLGDIVHSRVPQVFELLERHGLTVGAISAMNAENRLQAPAYFIPDPWTKTRCDDSWWSRSLTAAIAQTVNDNANSKVTLKSAMAIGLALLRFAQPKHYSTYLHLIRTSLKAPWRKALLLDLLLHDIHMGLFKAKRPNFSTLFLNAGAHIQHHYFFNAKPIRDRSTLRNPTWYIEQNLDPVAEVLDIYELILRDYRELHGVDVIVATGLSQVPYDRVKFYYRLRRHSEFLRAVGVQFKEVLPRMTRDFLLEFETVTQAAAAQERLARIMVDGKVPLFGEIDNRGSSLFVTLTFPQEITATTTFEIDGKTSALAPEVAFVAIKNGMHQAKGFAFFTPNVQPFAPRDGEHIKELYRTIVGYFGLRDAERLKNQLPS